MSTAETIYELVKTLPEEKANLVLVFTQFVQQRESSPQDSLLGADRPNWSDLVAELSGTWPDFPTAEELRENLPLDLVRETP
ncbi:DUF2281 domain-containing protein [Leptolyngbya sp. CCNP1308]|uniref:DUF2281 domain-containing protein n=1 Tax=Leptolyngbya sp. CCNP1308 TaxID=3110255 RepID=UPI002B1EA01D|nr:DUF2281 domain-containing protein [Leptolyngbya sp. CCNP1308]MEA5447074.1 DUF2281 domain-containing protein [Leptolyngbya sp. CCNP1308]